MSVELREKRAYAIANKVLQDIATWPLLIREHEANTGTCRRRLCMVARSGTVACNPSAVVFGVLKNAIPGLHHGRFLALPRLPLRVNPGGSGLLVIGLKHVTQDVIGHLLCNHYCRCIQISIWDVWEDRSIHNPQALHSMHAAFNVCQDERRVHWHCKHKHTTLKSPSSGLLANNMNGEGRVV